MLYNSIVSTATMAERNNCYEFISLEDEEIMKTIYSEPSSGGPESASEFDYSHLPK